MRTIFLSVAALAASVTAVPAAAQYWQLRPAVRNEIRQDINQLERQINRAAQRGTISRREANGLRRQALDLRRTYQRYARNGLSRREVAALETGVNRLHVRLRLERRDWDGMRG